MISFMLSEVVLTGAEFPNAPDVSEKLKVDDKHIATHGPLSVVYRCSYEQSMKVTVKAINFPSTFPSTEKDVYTRKVRRELGIWRRLEHPNIVPLLGTVPGKVFGSDYLCTVSMWMTNGTLNEYVENPTTILSHLDRVHLIKGSVTGLEYLHSKGIVHGDLHPANVLIDDNYNPRLTDLGCAQTLRPLSDQLSYLYTNTIRPGAMLWAAPELLYPELYPKPVSPVRLHTDIYSLGSIMFFILSGRNPWQNRVEGEQKLREFKSPPRPIWPVNMPDGVWDFIQQCWSLRNPESRPSAKEVLSFCTDKLEQLLRPNISSDINVVLFGASGSGKSSIINLLSGEQFAQESSDTEPCTKQPRWYQISVDEKQFQLWDTMGFSPAYEAPTDILPPYDQAHSVLRNLHGDVNVILLCADKDQIRSSPASLGRLYWFLNHFFYDGRAPIALVLRHFDTLDEEWWKRNKHNIARRTGIPTQFIPHACITTDQTGSDQSKHVLKELLRNYATSVGPIPLRIDLSSRPAALPDLTNHCKLLAADAKELVEMYRRPLRPSNIILFGETEADTSSIVSLIAGRPVAEAGPGSITYTRSYKINAGMHQFRIWDTMALDEVHTGHDIYLRALENIYQLNRDLSAEGGVDLLVFCKRFDRITRGELNSYRLSEETLCKGQFPAAIIVTHFESEHPAEKWWEKNEKELAKAMGRDVISYACIPPFARYDRDSITLKKKLVESRLSIEAMLEACVPFLGSRLQMAPAKSLRYRWATNHMTSVENLSDRYGLTKEQAERFIKLHSG